MKRLVPLLLLLIVFIVSCYPGAPISIGIPGQQPVINSFNSSPQSIAVGESSTLSWSITGATSVNIDQGIGNVALTGTRIVSPTVTTIYTLTATNSAGSVTATSQIIVGGGASPPPTPTPIPVPVPVPTPIPTPGYLPVINYFTANPPVISAGGTATLSWNVSDATSITIDNGVGSVGIAGTTPVSPASSTIYTLMAYNAVGLSSRTASVVVTGGGAFGVTNAVANVNPPSFTGACPETFNFSAVITTNGPCTVTYKWERSDGAIAPVESITFPAAGSQTVGTYWQLGASYSGWERVHILTPNSGVSNQASFALNCGVPFGVTNAVANVGPPSFTGACPTTFNFIAVITTSGPGTVTYRWERSDGATAPIQSITFPAAGSQTVGDTWTLGGSYAGWERVHILTPNNGVSNQANFVLNCL